jgi:preprotein translocase subunit SecF
MGVLVGTYSSLFNATPLAYDLLSRSNRKAEVKEKK